MTPANNLQNLINYLKEKEYSYIVKTSKEEVNVYVKTNRFDITLEYNYSIIGPNNIRLILAQYIHNAFNQVIENLQIDMIYGNISNIEVNRSINNAIVADCKLLNDVKKREDAMINPDVSFNNNKNKRKAIKHDMGDLNEEKEEL